MDDDKSRVRVVVVSGGPEYKNVKECHVCLISYGLDWLRSLVATLCPNTFLLDQCKSQTADKRQVHQ